MVVTERGTAVARIVPITGGRALDKAVAEGPIIIEEPSSLAALRLWDEADRVVSSRLVYAEGRATLAMAHRMERMDDDELQGSADQRPPGRVEGSVENAERCRFGFCQHVSDS